MSQSKTQFETWIVGSDIHVPKQNKQALSCFIKTIEKLKPYGVILNGDIMDCGVFSRHDINVEPKKHWTDSDFFEASLKDYEEAEKLLKDVRKGLSKDGRLVWLLGNHEVWLQDFIERSPTTRGKLFSLEKRLPLKELDVKVYPYKDIFKLGKLRVVHTLFDSGGAGGGKHHASKHVEVMGASVLYGHYHDIQSSSKVTPELVSHMAYSAGCLCDLNPRYLRNGPQNWSHGFAIVYVYPNNQFQVDIKRIVNNQVIIDGQLIKG